MPSRTNEALIDELVAAGVLKTEQIIAAFRQVDRADFILPQYLSEAYGDYPLPIGYNQTISQPTTVALMLEWLQPQPGNKILDIGSGSGWTTALLAAIAGQHGQVWGIEIIPQLTVFSRINLQKYSFPWAQILAAGGDQLGLPTQAPFDKVLVSAAAATELPDELVQQLTIGGRLVLPIGGSVWQIDKISATKVRQQEFPGFRFVSLKE